MAISTPSTPVSLIGVESLKCDNDAIKGGNQKIQAMSEEGQMFWMRSAKGHI